MNQPTNMQVLLAERPQGMPGPEHFRVHESPAPTPGSGEMLIRTIWLSVDPYMRGRISGAPSYAAPVEVGDVMVGGVVGEVIESNHPDFSVSDFVEGRIGWQKFGVSDGQGMRKIDPDAAPLSLSLGALGMPGLTAYFAMETIARVQPGETLLVSSAAGAVGSVAGQIAKIQGARAVGLAGSDAKVDYVVNELGFDACINYKTAPDLQVAMAEACPDGVDAYFDNVGGPTLDAAMQCLNLHARIVICGMISIYNQAGEPDIGLRPMRQMLNKRARMEGFLVSDHADRAAEGVAQLTRRYREGKLKTKEYVVEGLENAPAALAGLLSGENFGKMLVKVAEERG